MLTAEQHAERANAIGGSDIPAIFGVDKYRTALELYYRKRGEWTEPDEDGEDRFFANMGHHAEAELAAWFTRETGIELYRQRGTRRHRRMPYLIAHTDRLTRRAKPRGVVEFKMRASGEGWGANGSAEIPFDVHLQAQTYMSVLRRPVCYVCAFLEGKSRRRYEIPHSAELSDEIEARAAEFWFQVRTGRPPPLQYDHPTARELVHALHPRKDGTIAELPAEAADWIRVYLQAGARLKRLEAARAAIAAELQDLIGDASYGVTPDRGYRVVRSIRTRGDTRFTVLDIKDLST